MRTPGHLLLIALTTLVAPVAWATCDYPPDMAVKIPDGKTATDEEMAAARQAVQKYLGDMNAYMDCLDREEAALPPELQTPEEKALTAKRHNAAYDAEQAVASKFNDSLRAHKAAKAGN